MANHKKTEVNEEVFPQNSIPDVKPCRIINIANNKLHIYFDTYGIQIEIPKGNPYKIGDTVKVNYSGVIGQTNFKKWIID